MSSIIYAKEQTSDIFKQLVYEEYNKYNKLDIFLKRVKKYNPSERSQTEDEAVKLDIEFHKAVPKFDLEVNGEKESSSIIIDKILETLKLK